MEKLNKQVAEVISNVYETIINPKCDWVDHVMLSNEGKLVVCYLYDEVGSRVEYDSLEEFFKSAMENSSRSNNYLNYVQNKGFNCES